MSCAGGGYLSGNTLVAYPFEDGQLLAWGCPPEEARLRQSALEACFADASLSIDADPGSLDGDGWPSVGDFRFGGSYIDFSLSVRGVPFRLTASAMDSAERFPVKRVWTDWGTCAMTMSSEGIRSLLALGIPPPGHASPSPSGREGLWLRLCARCFSVHPRCLTSVRVYDGVGEMGKGPHFVLDGDVAIMAGNNMEAEAGDDGVTLSAVPGAGMGAIPCAGSSGKGGRPPIVGPDGHVRIFCDTCLDVEPGIVADADGRRLYGQIRLHSKCTSCCTCEMYGSIVNDRLRPLADTVRRARADIAGLLATYEEAVERFNARVSKPTLDDVGLTLTGMPAGGRLGPQLAGTRIRGQMGRCAFTAILRNSSYAVLDASVYSIAGTDDVVEASASWIEDGAPRTMTGDSAGAITGRTFPVRPGQSLALTFVSRSRSMVGSVTTGGYSGSVSIGLSYTTLSGERGSLGTISRSVEV